MSAWFSSSYMARRHRGRPRGKDVHHLTEAKQGSYQYVYGLYAAPVPTIAPGDVVVAETLDAFGGAIKSIDDKPSEKLKFPFVNPQNGPIAVEGAEKGDVLCVRIETIVPRGPQPVGTSALIPEFGGLVGNAGTPMLNPPLPRTVMKYHVTEDGVRFLGTTRSFCRSSLSSARSASAPDRSGAVATAGLLGRQHGPARRGPRLPSLIFPCKRKGPISFSAIAMAGRAMANCAASPSRSRRQLRSRSI